MSNESASTRIDSGSLFSFRKWRNFLLGFNDLAGTALDNTAPSCDIRKGSLHSGHLTSTQSVSWGNALSGSSNSVSQYGQLMVVIPFKGEGELGDISFPFSECFEGEFEAFDFAFETGDFRILLRYQRGKGGVGCRGGCAFRIVGEA